MPIFTDVFKFLTEKFNDLPRPIRALVYIVFVGWFVGASILTFQGHYLYKGRAMFVETESNRVEFAREHKFWLKEFDADFRSDESGNISVALSMAAYFAKGMPESLEALAEPISGGHVLPATLEIAGVFDRRATITIALAPDSPAGEGPSTAGPEELGYIPPGLLPPDTSRDRTFSLFPTAFAADDSPAAELKILSIKTLGSVSSSDKFGGFAVQLKNAQGANVMEAINPTVRIDRGIPLLSDQSTEVQGGRFVKIDALTPDPDGNLELSVSDVESGEVVDTLKIPQTAVGQPHFSVSGEKGVLEFEFGTKNGYSIIVYEREDTRRNLDSVIAAADESLLWYRPVRSRLQDIPTNAVYIGKSVPFDLARRYIEQLVMQWPGIELKRIAYGLDLKSGRNDTMQLGGSTQAQNNCETLSDDQLTQLFGSTDYAGWDAVLSDCQAGR